MKQVGRGSWAFAMLAALGGAAAQQMRPPNPAGQPPMPSERDAPPRMPSLPRRPGPMIVAGSPMGQWRALYAAGNCQLNRQLDTPVFAVVTLLKAPVPMPPDRTPRYSLMLFVPNVGVQGGIDVAAGSVTLRAMPPTQGPSAEAVVVAGNSPDLKREVLQSLPPPPTSFASSTFMASGPAVEQLLNAVLAGTGLTLRFKTDQDQERTVEIGSDAMSVAGAMYRACEQAVAEAAAR